MSKLEVSLAWARFYPTRALSALRTTSVPRIGGIVVEDPKPKLPRQEASSKDKDIDAQTDSLSNLYESALQLPDFSNLYKSVSALQVPDLSNLYKPVLQVPDLPNLYKSILQIPEFPNLYKSVVQIPDLSNLYKSALQVPDFSELFKPLLHMTDLSHLRNPLPPVPDFAELLKPLIDLLDFSKLFKSALQMPDLSQGIEQWHQGLGRVLQGLLEAAGHNARTRFWMIMLELGWPPPKDPPIAVMEEILTAYDEEGETVAREIADRLMTEMYNEDRIASMASDWQQNPLLARRWSILDAVIRAHHEGQYTLSVPVLLTQMEGLVADGVQHRGRMSQREYAIYLEERLASDDAGLSDLIAKEFFLTIVLTGFCHGEPLPSGGLSRHAILHGADADYGTATSSLKAIIMFDYLQASFVAPSELLEQSEDHERPSA